MQINFIMVSISQCIHISKDHGVPHTYRPRLYVDGSSVSLGAVHPDQSPCPLVKSGECQPSLPFLSDPLTFPIKAAVSGSSHDPGAGALTGPSGLCARGPSLCAVSAGGLQCPRVACRVHSSLQQPRSPGQSGRGKHTGPAAEPLLTTEADIP